MKCTWRGYGNLLFRGNLIPPGGEFEANDSDFSVMAQVVIDDIEVQFDNEEFKESINNDYHALTKSQLVAIADDIGLDLDTRMRKDDIIDAIENSEAE